MTGEHAFSLQNEMFKENLLVFDFTWLYEEKLLPKGAGEKKPTHFGRHPKLDCLSEKWETLIIYPIKFPVYRYLQCPENISNIRRMAKYVTF